MRSRTAIVGILLGGVYLAIFLYGAAHPIFFVNREWWYSILGVNSFSAIALMQVEHSLWVLIAALPVAIVTASFQRNNWKKLVFYEALPITLVILYDQIRGIQMILANGLHMTSSHIVSGLIDIVKVSVILYLAALVAVLLLTMIRKSLK